MRHNVRAFSPFKVAHPQIAVVFQGRLDDGSKSLVCIEFPPLQIGGGQTALDGWGLFACRSTRPVGENGRLGPGVFRNRCIAAEKTAAIARSGNVSLSCQWASEGLKASETGSPAWALFFFPNS